MGAVSITLYHGDCLEVMAAMEAGSVDAIVTDPPYGLEFMGKEWDRLGATASDFTESLTDDGRVDYQGKGNAPFGGGGKRVRFGSSAASMQDWHQAWATEALRVLKPSHYLLAFGGTRTWHRLACALEDAGFEIRDTLMWLHAQGFPKSTACLKPAWEPIILTRKPGPKRALGIEECRIGIRDESKMYTQPRPTTDAGGASWSIGEHVPFHYGDSGGRYPANLILDEEAGARLDGETGNRPGGGGVKTENGIPPGFGGGWSTVARPPMGDSGGASRFFYCAKASRSERNAGLHQVGHHDTAGAYGEFVGDGRGRQTEHRPARNHHPTVKPLALMRWLVKLVAYPGDTVLDPFTGSGTTGVACAEESREFVGIERELDYLEISRRRIEAASAQERLLV